jgi:hypothetical protein
MSEVKKESSELVFIREDTDRFEGDWNAPQNLVHMLLESIADDLAPKFDPVGKLVFKVLASGSKLRGAQLRSRDQSGERRGSLVS